MNRDLHSDAELRTFLEMQNVAVVGMSRHEGKAAHFVPKYLIDQGYNVIPVNPSATRIHGRRSFPTVSEVPERVDIVDVFRPSKDVPAVVRDVVNKEGIKVIWMQEGIYSEGAERIARDNGISVVYNRCIMVEHRRLIGDTD